MADICFVWFFSVVFLTANSVPPQTTAASIIWRLFFRRCFWQNGGAYRAGAPPTAEHVTGSNFGTSGFVEPRDAGLFGASTCRFSVENRRTRSRFETGAGTGLVNER